MAGYWLKVIIRIIFRKMAYISLPFSEVFYSNLNIAFIHEIKLSFINMAFCLLRECSFVVSILYFIWAIFPFCSVSQQV